MTDLAVLARERDVLGLRARLAEARVGLVLGVLLAVAGFLPAMLVFDADIASVA